MAEIPLGGKHGTGLFALVDDEDLPLVIHRKWTARPRHFKHGAIIIYAQGRLYPGNTEPMHRVILGLKPNDPRQVDHRNHNGLDNRKENLRLATHAQNMANRRRNGSHQNQFKRVAMDRGRWVAKITVNRRSLCLGGFATPEEAAMRYNVAARKYFGEFACFNQVDMG